MFKPLTESDVTFTLTMEPEDCSPVGHFASGDAAQDAADVEEIMERLDSGDESAWCCLVLTAEAPSGETETETLGCCSFEGGSGRKVRADAEELARDHGMYTEALARLNETLRQKATPRNMRMVTTRYAGPTDTRGGRVHARHVNTGKRASVAWDHALDAFENHAAAAAKLLGRDPEFYSSVDGGGYIMGVDPRNDPKE